MHTRSTFISGILAATGLAACGADTEIRLPASSRRPDIVRYCTQNCLPQTPPSNRTYSHVYGTRYAGIAGSIGQQPLPGIDGNGCFANANGSTAGYAVNFNGYGMASATLPVPTSNPVLSGQISGTSVVALPNQMQANFSNAYAHGAVWVPSGTSTMAVLIAANSGYASTDPPPTFTFTVAPPQPTDPANVITAIAIGVLVIGAIGIAVAIPALAAALAVGTAEVVIDSATAMALTGFVSSVVTEMGGLYALGLQSYYNYETTGSTNPFVPSSPIPPITSDPDCLPDAAY